MHTIFVLARLFPLWAIPLALALAQLGLFFRRRSSASQWGCWGVASALIVAVVLWIAFRGDLNSDSWIKALIQ
jgi:hypothetical protein